jgi:hypothetical protein
MRPLFSIDSFMVLGIDTRDVLPPLRILFFFGFSTSVNRGVERDRCLRWWWWWLVPPLLAPPTVPLAAPAVVLVRADSLSPVFVRLYKKTRSPRRNSASIHYTHQPAQCSSSTRLSSLLHTPLPPPYEPLLVRPPSIIKRDLLNCRQSARVKTVRTYSSPSDSNVLARTRVLVSFPKVSGFCL